MRRSAPLFLAAALAVMQPASAQSTFSWQKPPAAYEGWITYKAYKVANSPGERETTRAAVQVNFTLAYSSTIRKARTLAWSETYYNGTARYQGKFSRHTVTAASCGSEDIDVHGSGSMGLRMRFTPSGYLVGPTSAMTMTGAKKYPYDDTDCSKGFAKEKTQAGWSEVLQHGQIAGPLPTSGNVLCGTNTYHGSVLQWRMWIVGVPQKPAPCTATANA